MAGKAKGKFWSGPITTRPHAEKIINETGWTFVVLGVLVLMGGVGGGREPEASFSALAFGLLLSVSAGFLLNYKSRIPAGLLIGVSILGGLAALKIAFGETAAHTRGQFEFGLVGAAICLFLAALSWRALKATEAFERLPEEEPVAVDPAPAPIGKVEKVASTFD